MGCRFIFPESDFDPSNWIRSRNLSVLTSTLIGLATESSLNRFSISLSTLFPVATGHNRNAAAKSRKSRSWRQKKFSGCYSLFAYVRQNSTTEFGVQISNLSFYFHILYGTLNFDIKVPWEPKMLIGRLCHTSNYSFFSMSIKRGMEVRLSKACTRGFSLSEWRGKTPGNQGKNGYIYLLKMCQGQSR